MTTIAVIPAREGSKGIPRKNMRLMKGLPLISYAIENALAVDGIDMVVVSTDSAEILSFVGQYERVIGLERDPSLAGDAVTLDPVIYDAVRRTEESSGTSVDTVITLQATSPLLTPATLSAALASFHADGYDSLISVVNAPHLSWHSDGGRIVPSYTERLNRQQLPANYLETGAFLITRRSCVTEKSRLGDNVSVFEVPHDEAIDIDSSTDWVACEALLSKKRIAFRVDGYGELGMGHVYRALTLAYAMTEHEVVFLSNASRREGIAKLKDSNMKVVEIADDDELFRWLDGNRPDVYVHDCLDTSLDFIRTVKPLCGRVVTFEDLGDGAREADAVINALYEGASPYPNVYTGKAYETLRDEFMTVRGDRGFSPRVERILVMFGGTDPLNLSKRIYDLAVRFNEGPSPVHFDFILGPGYAHDDLVPIPDLDIDVLRDVVRVSDYMSVADAAFSSQGRTTFELASMGVPTIVLAQNEREQLHEFAQMNNGFINLGLGSRVSDDDIEATLAWLIGAESIRREMRSLMLSIDLTSGIQRVKRIVLGEN
ncbi:cytidylyltransferase domain-containing protein [Actinomyces mediterranea]|uniref:cytidylyltransferase domain-containing protein n=1 Tax=Actinomyces mediterranea TaxID=1871028 RepID=UPI0009702683|nr:acylneuraminate cytidylyltransferase [Actinomyces mediterranea]